MFPAGCGRDQLCLTDSSDECCSIEEQSGNGGKDWSLSRARLSTPVRGRNGIRPAPTDECQCTPGLSRRLIYTCHTGKLYLTVWFDYPSSLFPFLSSAVPLGVVTPCSCSDSRQWRTSVQEPRGTYPLSHSLSSSPHPIRSH